jgi:hypothetical protein
MVIWRSVGVQALAEALSLWAHNQARKGNRPGASAAEPPAAMPGDGDRRDPGAEPKIVYNADRRG